jgi:hypothetical protein
MVSIFLHVGLLLKADKFKSVVWRKWKFQNFLHSILSIHSSLFFSENVINAVKFCIVEILFKACSRILNISIREEDTVAMLIVAVLFL